MFVGIKYNPKNVIITAILLKNGYVGFKAVDIVYRILKYTHVANALQRYLPNEVFFRYSDLMEKYHKNNTIVLSYNQVIKFLSNCTPCRQDQDFLQWFIDIGHLKLYPVCNRTYQHALQNPDYNGITFTSPVISTEQHYDEDFFTLSSLSAYLKSTMSPESSKETNVVDTTATFEECEEEEIESPENISSKQPEIEDKSKSFDYTDPKTNETYRFLAIHLNWPKNISAGISPYFDFENNYAYVPVRITNDL